MKSLKKKLKSVIVQLISINDHPRNIALGYALGIFLATTPFVGCKAFIAIGITYILKWNKVASVIGVFHVNGINGAAFYGLVYATGNYALGYHNSFVFPDQLNVKSLINCFIASSEIFYSLLVGGLIFGIPLCIAAYWLVKIALKKAALIKVGEAHLFTCNS
jgi:uncharacterized protein (DUF2062 family)